LLARRSILVRLTASRPLPSRACKGGGGVSTTRDGAARFLLTDFGECTDIDALARLRRPYFATREFRAPELALALEVRLRGGRRRCGRSRSHVA
jgi:hypothetical protein